jgi:hypothetical protein
MDSALELSDGCRIASDKDLQERLSVYTACLRKYLNQAVAFL